MVDCKINPNAHLDIGQPSSQKVSILIRSE